MWREHAPFAAAAATSERQSGPKMATKPGRPANMPVFRGNSTGNGIPKWSPTFLRSALFAAGPDHIRRPALRSRRTCRRRRQFALPFLKSENGNPMKTITLTIAALGLSTVAAFAQGATVDLASIDTDGNGTVSLAEAQVVWPDLTQEQFTTADADASGELSAEEVATLPAPAPAQ
jgi:hypothetical protein